VVFAGRSEEAALLLSGWLIKYFQEQHIPVRRSMWKVNPPPMTSASVYSSQTRAIIQNLEEANPLREPTLRSIIAALDFAPGSDGLDIGCGIGLQTLLLAKVTAPAGRVTGLDISAELLDYARSKIAASPLADRITFKEGDMQRLPFPSDSFDWVWSADCVGYPAGDLLATLREIARVLKPGGRVAILAWTSQQLLPGYPLLEAQLNATCSAYAPLLRDADPASHFMRALRSFSDTGLTEVKAQTFVSEVQAPLSTACRVALTSLIEMLWSVSPAAPEADRMEYQRLCRAASPDFILNLPEYYAFFTYTLFSGTAAK
jgi:demethylmenaquinone methyltransferase/2-methoxy-6-polyprenyl-1,4-benzoquinol methylase